MRDVDLRYLRYAIMVAERSRLHGNPPFGALLVSDRGWILLESENTQEATHDFSCHAEINLLRQASRRFSRKLLSHSTLYASAEPCAMCAGAIFWSGVGRVVYGLSNLRLHALTENQAEHLFQRCADVLARGTRHVEVLGPLLEEEAAQVLQKSLAAPRLTAH